MLNNLVALLDSGVAASTTSYESIATVTVGAGGASDMTFSSIPSTYKHLQIRFFGFQGASTNSHIQVGSSNTIDTGSNYAWHELYGDGASAAAGAGASQTYMKFSFMASGGTTYPQVGICDILDYQNTNKYKTIRVLAGSDMNGATGYVMFRSGLWQSSNALNTIKIFPASGSFNQYTTAALYGVKG